MEVIYLEAAYHCSLNYPSIIGLKEIIGTYLPSTPAISRTARFLLLIDAAGHTGRITYYCLADILTLSARMKLSCCGMN